MIVLFFGRMPCLSWAPKAGTAAGQRAADPELDPRRGFARLTTARPGAKSTVINRLVRLSPLPIPRIGRAAASHSARAGTDRHTRIEAYRRLDRR